MAELKRQNLFEGEGWPIYEEGDVSKISKFAPRVNKKGYQTPNDEGYEEFFYRELPGKADMHQILPQGANKDQRPDFVKIWLDYDRQIFNSKGFECKDYPFATCASTIKPLTHPSAQETKLMMELAELAIQQYNEKECNVFKYKVLKIEKANAQPTSFFQYYMTVKVLNITLGSVIETFQIFAAKGMGDDYKKVYSCEPKVKVAADIVHHDYRTPLVDVGRPFPCRFGSSHHSSSA